MRGAVQFLAEVGVRDGDHAAGAFRQASPFQFRRAEFGDDDVHFGARGGDGTVQPFDNFG